MRKDKQGFDVQDKEARVQILTDTAGESVIFPMETFSSSKEAMVWCRLFGCTGLISIRYLFGSSSSESESLDE